MGERSVNAIRATALLLLLSSSGPAWASVGSPDCFGYTWADQCCDCSQEIPDFGPSAQTFTGVTDVVGPVPLQFLHRWYGRPATAVWVAPSGYVTFSDQGPNVGQRQSFPDPAPPNDMLAVIWLEAVDADITVESTPDFLHVRWVIRWVTDPTRPWEVHLVLLPNGGMRMHWPSTWGQLYATVGHEDASGDCGRLLFEGRPDDFETHEDEGTFPTPAGDHSACISPPALLDCADTTVLRCGETSASSLPGSDLTPTSVHGCEPRTWAATERAFEVQVDELADVQLTLRPSGGQQMGLFHVDSCDEWSCSGFGLSSLTVPGLTPGDHALVVVDAEQAGVDEGSFSLELSCVPLSEPFACGETISNSTLGGFTRLDAHGCLAGDFSGPENYYTVEVASGDNLDLSLSSSLGHALFVFDSALPLDPEHCLTGGTTTAWLPDPSPGTYIVVIDGPAGSEGDYELSLNCRPQLACSPGASPIGCNETVSGTTLSAAASVDDYACGTTAYPGGEAVHLFENPFHQVVTFRLDDAADESLDILLLDSCNEQACLASADDELSIELAPGSYRVVIDGSGPGADYSLTTICGQGIVPDFISVSRNEGECFTEHETVWLTPEVPPIDILFSIDLSGSMIPERAQLPANIIDVIERLPSLLPDVAVGLVSHRDYYYSCLGWSDTYCRHVPSDFGEPGDWPYRLHHPITKQHGAVIAEAETLPPADFGGTSGEAYNRIMFEAVNDPNIDWRPGAQRMLVTFGDDLPHDCDLASCFGGPPIQRGIDLGRDGLPDTGDELPTLDVLQGLIDNETILLHLDSSGGQSILGIPYQQFWSCWAEQTGGLAEEINDDGSIPTGMDLALLIAGLVERRQVCDTLQLVAEPGYEDWLSFAGQVYSDVELPSVVGFDIEICVPPGTPAGVHEFEVQAFCGTELVAAQQVQVRVGLDCSPVVDPAPADEVICPGETAELDASGLSLRNGAGTVEYEWRDGALTVATEPTVIVSPETTTSYDVTLTCSTDPDCSYTDAATITVLDDIPDGVYLALRASHRADEATFHWAGARNLLPGEHFHLLKTSDHPANDFVRVNAESDLSRSFTETDIASPLQFFDLRVATACEVQSEDEYPPTYP